uniref:WW domain-containing protein n=1 Tax=Astyanax mexicanus TaxID=7994 RepID=A0A8B9HES1_ASTMX
MLAILLRTIRYDIWGEQAFQTDPDLPPGWKMMTDMAGIYYWHIPTGTTQWERPGPCHPVPTGPAHHPRKHSLSSLSPSPTPDHEGKDMYLILENNMLNLVDPMDRSVLHSQPIASIRVWGVGRDNGR